MLFSFNFANLLFSLQVGESPDSFQRLGILSSNIGLYINFNTVECRLPSNAAEDEQSYLVSVSNDGNRDHASDPLLFIPFDSSCEECSTNSTSCRTVSVFI